MLFRIHQLARLIISVCRRRRRGLRRLNSLHSLMRHSLTKIRTARDLGALAAAAGAAYATRAHIHMSADNVTLVLQAWLVILALFEVEPILKILKDPTRKMGGFGSGMSDVAARQLWCFMLVLLVLSRVAMAVDPHSRVVAFHCAAVHIGEAVYMTANNSAGAKGRGVIWMAMLFNAALFLTWALKL